MCTCVHQPLGIAEHVYHQVRIGHLQSVQLRECDTQLRRTTCIKYNHIGLSTAECLREVTLARLQIGDIALHVVLLQLSAQCSRKASLLTCGIVAVDYHRMKVLECLHKVLDSSRVLLCMTLVHLIASILTWFSSASMG